MTTDHQPRRDRRHFTPVLPEDSEDGAHDPDCPRELDARRQCWCAELRRQGAGL